LKTKPDSFQNPHSLRNRCKRLLWNTVWQFLKLTPPRIGWPLRKPILRLFGAKIGKSWLHGSVRIWDPGRLVIGDHCYIDRDVFLYNPWPITLEDRVIISFGALLCTPSHDITHPSLPLIGKPIQIESDVWVACESFVGNGVTVHEGAVVGARSVVVKPVDPWTIVGGNPAKFLKDRKVLGAE
jgi:putative colanic acid biosynthesis acetyltransferase WcaF